MLEVEDIRLQEVLLPDGSKRIDLIGEPPARTAFSQALLTEADRSLLYYDREQNLIRVWHSTGTLTYQPVRWEGFMLIADLIPEWSD